MKKPFEGNVVLVTGGSSGIGETTALAFAQGGARVFATARRRAALDAARAAHPNVTWLLADVASATDMRAAVAAIVDQAGRLDVLVNNAAVFEFGPLEASAEAMVRMQVDINIVGLVLATQAALPALIASRGAIVNIGSVVGHKAAAGASIYAATKAAVESLTRSWALELAPKGVRVNAIAPGPTATRGFDNIAPTPEARPAVRAQFTSQVPLGRMASTDEIARWIVHAADPGSGWLTGAVIAIDGGMSLT